MVAHHPMWVESYTLFSLKYFVKSHLVSVTLLNAYLEMFPDQTLNEEILIHKLSCYLFRGEVIGEMVHVD